MPKLFASLILTLILIAPAGLVVAENPAGGGKIADIESKGIVNKELCTGIEDCTFDKLFGLDNESNSLVKRVLNFAVFYLALPLAVIMITWGGILIATNSANPSGIKEGKTYIYYAVGGLILVLAAYLIIKTIVNTLSNDEVFELSFNYVVNVII
ncbi:MAG: hypothetical protein A2114_00315 [Candidatus Vogelbacteria bacterium GWA1_51_14]|uniref:Uncharacterized protein n=1 Tax=Candidatus Vogelbacteria bacterium GWA1_51_14 TaxID=1802435 RepID=A0A1G2Q9Z7_9BACT|nr:MAG: hypothetical protein A2114_00315 [Candidatus Vogelbacteria bacterium GWA1_51_14]